MQTVNDELNSVVGTSPVTVASTSDGQKLSGCFSNTHGLDKPKKIESAAGVQLQVGTIVGHKIRVVPCTSLAGDEVPIGTAEFSHVKVAVQKVKCAERHRNLETGNFDMWKPQYKGADLGKISKLVLEIGGTVHTLAPKGGRLEMVLSKEAVSLPATAALSMEYESIVVSTSSRECPWFAGDCEFSLDFQEPQDSAGCCVIA